MLWRSFPNQDIKIFCYFLYKEKHKILNISFLFFHIETFISWRRKYNIKFSTIVHVFIFSTLICCHSEGLNWSTPCLAAGTLYFLTILVVICYLPETIKGSPVLKKVFNQLSFFSTVNQLLWQCGAQLIHSMLGSWPKPLAILFHVVLSWWLPSIMISMIIIMIMMFGY